MGGYCVLNPQVKSERTGEMVDSKLFADLKRAVGYERARKVYLRVRDQSFIDEHEAELSRDANGEYTLASLKFVPELAPLLGVRVRRTVAAREVDAYAPVQATKENILDAEARSMAYNAKPDNEFIALPEVYEDNEGNGIVRIKLVPYTSENREKASRIVRKQVLVSRLSNAVQRIGVDPEVIDILMDRFRNDGMEEYDAALAIAEGLSAVVDRAYGKTAPLLTLPRCPSSCMLLSLILR